MKFIIRKFKETLAKYDTPRIDGCAKLHEFSGILVWLFVLMTVFSLGVY